MCSNFKKDRRQSRRPHWLLVFAIKLIPLGDKRPCHTMSDCPVRRAKPKAVVDGVLTPAELAQRTTFTPMFVQSVFGPESLSAEGLRHPLVERGAARTVEETFPDTHGRNRAPRSAKQLVCSPGPCSSVKRCSQQVRHHLRGVVLELNSVALVVLPQERVNNGPPTSLQRKHCSSERSLRLCPGSRGHLGANPLP